MLKTSKKSNRNRRRYGNNPRSQTLGWFYETPQIKSHIDSYRGIVSHKPKSKIQATTGKTHKNKFIQDAISHGNIKVSSIAKNILT